MGMKILSTARYLPPTSLKNDDLKNYVDTSDEWIYKRTGIKSRFISSGENTSDLCIETARRLLKKSALQPKEIGLIIVCTITPDYLTPSTACIVQGAIGAENAFAFDISAACSGFVYGLSVAHKFLNSGSVKHVMLIGADVQSKVTDWSDRKTCVLFGDGAGGILFTAVEEYTLLAEDLHSDGTRGNSLTAGYSKVVNPLTHEESLKDYIKMDGRDIFDFAIRKVPLSISTALEKADLTMKDVKYVIAHQANYRIIEGIAKKLKTDIGKFYTNIDKYGNTSAATIPIAFDEMCEASLIQDGDIIIFTGFGGGLTWGSIIIKYKK